MGGTTFITTSSGRGSCLPAELLNGTPSCGRGSARWAGPRPGSGHLIGCLPRNFRDPARVGGVTWSRRGCTSCTLRGSRERLVGRFGGWGRTGGPRAAAFRGSDLPLAASGRPGRGHAGPVGLRPRQGPGFGGVCFHPSFLCPPTRALPSPRPFLTSSLACCL